MSQSLDWVLAQVIADEGIEQGGLARWLAEYPQFACEIAQAVTDRVLCADLGDGALEEPDDADSPFMQALARFDPAALTRPIETLSAEARRQGMAPRDLADRLDVDPSILAKLERGLIRVETVPCRLAEALALALNRSVETVVAYLRRPAPRLAVATLSFRAPSAPVARVNCESFADAVRSAPAMQGPVGEVWLRETDLLG